MIKFGTGGWRAIIADGFTKENIRLVVAGLCALMKKEGHQGNTVVLGYDRRFLSKEAMQWAAEVLAGYGYHALLINRSAPTPLIMFTVKQMGLPYGMAITASHNPAIYNGIKIFTQGGRDADQSVTSRVEAEIVSIDPGQIKSIAYSEALSQGLITEDYPFNDYIDSILNLIDTEKIRRSRLRIALDPMYGVSQDSLRTILMTCRCNVEVIHDEHDTLFGGRMPAPSAEALKLLANYVVDRRCHLGIATDGDADRIGVIDEHGNYLHANTILVLLYYYLLEYRGWKGPCVRNYSTTHLLDRVAEAYGEICYEVPVGFKHISAKMAEVDAIIGGESSGGLAVRGHIAGKDGIYAAALLVEMVAATGKSVSQLYEEIAGKFGSLYYEEASVKMTLLRKQQMQDQIFLQHHLPKFPQKIQNIVWADGCKVKFEDGSWVICRFSGTEPLLRLAAEAQTRAEAKAYIASWETLIK